ncbi:carboxylesterase [Gammaproteobacteria bacterium 42_54_T18]|nr:carboxylesterase [Gammaproteobacteria bacterium 42_54_T18]
MLMTSLSTVEVNPSTTASAAVIWLHGFGADGHDFESIIPQLNLPASMAIRFIFPHAPMRNITRMGGDSIRAWFDIDKTQGFDVDGIKKSTFQIKDLIQQEIDNGIPAERIVLAGFSQGGAIALNTALLYRKPLAGILALSTFLPVAEALGTKKFRVNAAIPILVCHGKQDEVLPLTMGKAGFDTLKSHNYAVQWREYDMAHSVCPQQIQDISAWFQKVLK